MSIQISVIIPVYNAAFFIKKAIHSALAQPEVAEIIVIDDGSTDDSLQICQKIAAEHYKVHTFSHANNKNLGVSASRNLGLIHSTQDYISFLDADDYYLPNRFKDASDVLQKHPNLLGVYTGHKIEIINNINYDSNPKIKSIIEPNLLFQSLVTSGEYFYIIDLTIRKSMLPKKYRFDERLHYGEDTDFILGLCLHGHLQPVALNKPVLSRVIHSNNTIHSKKKSQKGKYLLNKKWFNRVTQEKWPKTVNRRLLLNLLEGKYGHIQNKGLRLFRKGIQLGLIIIKQPILIFKLF